ncbi:AP-1 complex subunit gamma-1 [Phytophthora cinnamomi]|uniref:AP-1 complex subunit gamma-1 n=1 Tax=Phytophthora cinnamomi TaxID=4785 RepID=UPI003559FBA3|nr:AP-1 complex subunit gamma-1 [Phytophthora cinnamomi]
MKFTLPENAFRQLDLTKEQQNALIQEAESVVRETLEENEAFLAGGSKFSNEKWRLWAAVARESKCDVVYGDRSRAGTEQSTMSTDVESSTSSVLAKNKLMQRPVMVLHGTVDGSLDDCMFGTFASTDEAWKWRSSHINDRLDDARILATIRKPTHDDPFQFLGIKWFAKERPAVLSSIMQQRDYLIMEATGLTKDSKGEKIGYYLMHSISLPGVPELTDLGIIRAKLSLCFIDRQKGPGKVEKYCRNYSDPGGKILDRVAAAVGAEAIISASKVVDYAYVKKLTWLMKEKGAPPRESDRPGMPRPKRCETCFKNFSKFAIGGGVSSACAICRRAMCAKCSVIKKMTVDVSSTGAVRQCALRFCLNCLMEAKEQSVWDMALSGVETASETSSTSGSGYR